MINLETFTANLNALQVSGARYAVKINITDTQGSSPRESGSTMLVTTTSVYGSIGGGHLEYKALKLAQSKLAAEPSEASTETLRFPLGPSLGQCCGGVVNILMQVIELPELISIGPKLHAEIYPQHFHVVVFGAGHIGQALISILGTLPCSVHWIDSREQLFPDTIPGNVLTQISDTPEYEVAKLPEHANCVIMTHNHQLDEKIVAAILKRKDSNFCGLIGSRSKRLRFEKRLLARGLSSEQLATLVCPIGDGAITGKHPGEIAMALASQLLQLAQNPVTMQMREVQVHQVEYGT